MSRQVFVSALVGSLGAFGVLLAPAPALASNPVTYTAADPAPDVSGAPDVTSVLVSDSTQGLITFQLNFAPGTEQPTLNNYNIYIDADQNPTTGDPSGAGTDYLLEYDGTPNGGLGLFKWDGASSYQFVKSASLQGSFSGDSQYFVIAASELEITDGFNFNVSAAVGPSDVQSSQIDFIPEDGTNVHYSMQSKANIKLQLADWEDSAVAHAGKIFSTALLVTRSDTGAPLVSGGTVKCTLALHGVTVSVLEEGFIKVPWYKGGPKTAAVCIWHLPTSFIGAVLTAKTSVTLGNSTVSRVFTARVRK